MNSSTSILPRELRHLAGKRNDTTALRQKELGIWQVCSWSELGLGIDQVAAGLIDLQVQPGEVVGIVSSACRDWVLADLGGQCAGAVVAGLHATDTVESIHQHVQKLAVRVLLIEDDGLFESIAEVGGLPQLEHIVVFRTEGLRRATDARLLSLQELRERGAQALAKEPALVERALASRRETDDAVVISTAGAAEGTRTLRLSHQALLAACSAAAAAFPDETETRGERVLFFPLSHAVERIGSLYAGLLQGAILNFVEGQDTVFDNLREVQPKVLQAVPRFWEKLRSNLAVELNEATGAQQWLYRRSVGLGLRMQQVEDPQRPTPAVIRWIFRALDLLVLSNLRRIMGLGRLRVGVVVGGSASPEMITWFRSMGVDLRHAWSCAEMGGFVCVGGASDAPDSVGRPLPGLEVRVAGNGELLVRSAHFPVNEPWHRTGDLGTIDSNGRVYVAGRFDDVIVTAQGEEVQPAELERRIKASPYIADAIVVGQERPHLACLVVLNREAVEQWAQKRQVPFSDLRSLCDSEEVRELVADEVERTAVGTQSQRVRTVKPIALMSDGDPSTYTPSLSLKRASVLGRFASTVEGLYRPAAV